MVLIAGYLTLHKCILDTDYSALEVFQSSLYERSQLRRVHAEIKFAALDAQQAAIILDDRDLEIEDHRTRVSRW